MTGTRSQACQEKSTSAPPGHAGRHDAVRHPVELRVSRHRGRWRGLAGLVRRADDDALTGLSRVFGWPATVWLFFALPLVARFLGAAFQGQFFYYSSGWVQLFALPLLTYIGVKLQRSSDAQSEVMHQALTHIALVSDQNRQLLRENTELTRQAKHLTERIAGLAEAVHERMPDLRAPEQEAGPGFRGNLPQDASSLAPRRSRRHGSAAEGSS